MLKWNTLVFYVQGFTGSNLGSDIGCVDVVYTYLSRIPRYSYMSPICPDRQYNLINIVRRIAMCMEVGKTDYMYKAVFNDSNLNRFWRCDNRIILLGMRFQYYLFFDGSCENICLTFFYLPSFPSFTSSDFLTLYHFLFFPLLLSSSCFLLCISVAGKQLFFHSTFLLSFSLSLFFSCPFSFFLSVFISVLLPIFILSRLQIQYFPTITV